MRLERRIAEMDDEEYLRRMAAAVLCPYLRCKAIGMHHHWYGGFDGGPSWSAFCQEIPPVVKERFRAVRRRRWPLWTSYATFIAGWKAGKEQPCAKPY